MKKSVIHVSYRPRYFSKPGGGVPVSHHFVKRTSFVFMSRPTILRYSSKGLEVPIEYCSIAENKVFGLIMSLADSGYPNFPDVSTSHVANTA